MKKVKLFRIKSITLKLYERKHVFKRQSFFPLKDYTRLNLIKMPFHPNDAVDFVQKAAIVLERYNVRYLLREALKYGLRWNQSEFYRTFYSPKSISLIELLFKEKSVDVAFVIS